MNFEWTTILLAFSLTLIAGLSTGIGSLIAYFAKGNHKHTLAFALGLSAGVMIFVSFVELYPQASKAIASSWGSKQAELITALAFFGGMGLIALIDRLIPSYENPHETRDLSEMHDGVKDQKLMRLGMLSALAIAIHNFPEGIATFIGGLSDSQIAYPITVAIALHNIPEGIAVSIPIFYATGSRRKALKYSILSGLSEPLGALIGFALIWFFIGINQTVFGVLWAVVAGIMVFISLDELLPSARAYGAHHVSIYGLIFGMALMAISLWAL